MRNNKAKVEVAGFMAEKLSREHPSDYWSKPDVSARFPVLKSLARQYHSAPATSAESERWFS